jgi:hypothetical protein
VSRHLLVDGVAKPPLEAAVVLPLPLPLPLVDGVDPTGAASFGAAGPLTVSGWVTLTTFPTVSVAVRVTW